MGQTQLSEIIQQKIQNEGPISFRDFMEMALYYPELGYYNSSKNKIGAEGDYYTSPNLTPLFGGLIGRQLEEMWGILGEQPFTVVEYGAGTGLLCHDILDYLKKNEKLYRNLNYCIIEQSPVMQAKEKVLLDNKVAWYNSISNLPEITGCVLSNELIDNFPVHQVVMENALMEVFVDYNNGFTEVLKPAREELQNYLKELKITLPKGFRTEICLDSIKWLKDVSLHLKSGYVMTIDYGHLADELYNEHRSSGTVMCYNKHRVNDDPYIEIGEQDITAQVNFSALSHWGQKNGLDLCGFTNQANFLLALGYKDYLKTEGLKPEEIIRLAAQDSYLTNLLLVDMGSKYKVLIQQKGLDKHELKGLKIA